MDFIVDRTVKISKARPKTRPPICQFQFATMCANGFIRRLWVAVKTMPRNS